ncbi:MAG: hypothetical protein V9E98_09220 [Candidatus Nanopelagicales bacterium]
MNKRTAVIALGMTGLVTVAAGCSSSSTPAPSTPATNAPATDASATEAAPTATGVPAPPSGAKQLSSSQEETAIYTRYEISGMTPQQVVSSYEQAATSAGYSVTNSGGSGGGWGGYGGAGAGMVAQRSGSYLDVQAGGETSGPTYFEVCVGADEAAVDHCDASSQQDSKSSGS